MEILKRYFFVESSCVLSVFPKTTRFICSLNIFSGYPRAKNHSLILTKCWLYMCVYMCVYICVYMYICMCIYMCIHVHVNYVCICVCIHGVYICMYIFRHCVYKRACMSIHILCCFNYIIIYCISCTYRKRKKNQKKNLVFRFSTVSLSSVKMRFSLLM